MPIKFTYTNPNFKDGKPFNFVGLGTVLNGVPMTLTEEQEVRYRLRTRKTVMDGFAEMKSVRIEGKSSIKPPVKGGE